MLLDDLEIRQVRGLTDEQVNLAKAFIKGSVYCWVKNKVDEPFSVRNLFGGVNTDWRDTPLHDVWHKHIKNGKSCDEAYDLARKDVGWLLRMVLHEDKYRKFSSRKEDLTSIYFWENREEFEQ
ncbi:hypothetical protein IHV77_08295 [Rodentibacter haemolyticus]|uniref:Uncharacterized protein n=2 Tax=Rodentibacter haemolyticus TaxID=2778911 RepID=A0ABX6V0B1_9PAST|nr:hypothetical protein IHV77_08295 [Rodentibacter haemolyticus]